MTVKLIAPDEVDQIIPHIPPGQVVEETDIPEKGQVLATFNPHTDLWQIRRVVKVKGTREAKRMSNYGGRNTSWRNPVEISYVNLNAMPEEGKDGTAGSHYKGQQGFWEQSVRTLVTDAKNYHRPEWYWVDHTSTEGQQWIADRQAEEAEAKADKERTQAHLEDTPEQFENRLEAKAHSIDLMAAEADRLASQLRDLAAEIRAEKRPRYW